MDAFSTPDAPQLRAPMDRITDAGRRILDLLLDVQWSMCFLARYPGSAPLASGEAVHLVTADGRHPFLSNLIAFFSG